MKKPMTNLMLCLFHTKEKYCHGDSKGETEVQQDFGFVWFYIPRKVKDSKDKESLLIHSFKFNHLQRRDPIAKVNDWCEENTPFKIYKEPAICS